MSGKTLDNQSLKIIKEKQEAVQHSVAQLDFLNNYIFSTLESFGFRYFNEPRTPEVISNNTLRIIAVENGIKEAIKIQNPKLRQGISDLVKRVRKEEGPTIVREIRVVIDKNSSHGGTCKLSGRISFGHPAHDFSEGTYVENIQVFDFEDEFIFRNILAKYLEIVCELF